MTKIRTVLCAALLLATIPSCAPGGGGVSSTPAPATSAPAPKADARAIALAFAAAEELTHLSAACRRSGHPACQPGTATAIRTAGWLDAAARYLEAASSAQKLANTDLADINLRDALALLAQARRIVAPYTAEGASP